jgi:hypothetical protein
MAIYPYFSTTIINKDVLINSSFKAGMALVLDSNGRAIKADSQLLMYDSAAQKYGKFLGFATSDHDVSGNTIIIPDVIGSNYLDSNLNFIKSENTEYSVPKRSLLDYQDTAISSFYNNTDLNPTAKRGVGVYNTTGDYFVTDQFNPVLHGDYGIDSTVTVTLNSGDLLTFGGGINAGKLVKVNVDSIGPEVLIIGKVVKHVQASGLLYFKQLSFRLSFVDNIQFAIDAANPYSYSSGNTVYDLSTNGNNGTLYNGVAYSSFGGGSFYFDGSNDYIRVLDSPSLNPGSRPLTTMTWVKIDGFPAQNQQGGNIIHNKENLYEFGYSTSFFEYAYQPIWAWYNIGFMDSTSWKLLVVTYDKTNFRTYVNGTLNNTTAASGDTGSNNEDLGIGARGVKTGPNSFAKMYLSDMRIYFSALTSTQISNYYNSTKGRYGL